MTDREDAAQAQPDRVGNLSAGEVGRAGSTGFGVRLGRGAHQRGVRARTFARSGRNLKSVRSFRQGSRSIEYIGSAYVPGSRTLRVLHVISSWHDNQSLMLLLCVKGGEVLVVAVCELG